MGWVPTPKSSHEPPSGGAFLTALGVLALLVTLLICWLNATGRG